MSAHHWCCGLVLLMLGCARADAAAQWVDEPGVVLVSNGSLYALTDPRNARVRLAVPMSHERVPDAQSWHAVPEASAARASRDARWIAIPDGEAGSAQRTVVWDVADGVPWIIERAAPLAILGNAQQDLAVLSAGDDGRQSLDVWDLAGRQRLLQTALPAPVEGRSWQGLAPSSHRHVVIATQGSASVRIWDHDDRTLSPMQLNAPVESVTSLRLSPDGRYLAQPVAGGVAVYRITRGADMPPRVLEWSQGAEPIGWTSQGRYLLARGREGDGAVSLLQLDAASGRLLHRWQNRGSAGLSLEWLSRKLGRQFGEWLSDVPVGPTVDAPLDLSVDGRWLAVAGGGSRGITVFDVSESPPRRVRLLCLPGECGPVTADAELRWSPSGLRLLVGTRAGLWLVERETAQARQLLDKNPGATRQLAVSMHSALKAALCATGVSCPEGAATAHSTLVQSRAALQCRNGEDSACYRLLKQGRERGDRLAVQFAVRHGCGLLNAEPLCGDVATAYGCRANVDGVTECEDWPQEWTPDRIEALISDCAEDAAGCAHVGLLHTTVPGKAVPGLKLLQAACATGRREACIRGGRAALELDLAVEARRFHEQACRLEDAPDCADGLRLASLALAGEPQYAYNDNFSLEGNVSYNVYLAIREEHWRCDSEEEHQRLGMNLQYWDSDRPRARKRCAELRHEAAVERTRQSSAAARAARVPSRPAAGPTIERMDLCSAVPEALRGAMFRGVRAYEAGRFTGIKVVEADGAPPRIWPVEAGDVLLNTIGCPEADCSPDRFLNRLLELCTIESGLLHDLRLAVHSAEPSRNVVLLLRRRNAD